MSPVPTESNRRSLSAETAPRNVRPRVWRACEICRRRKIRCDGQDPCKFCETTKQTCSFTPVEDHAAMSRQKENDAQTRLKILEDKLDKLIPLVESSHSWLMQTKGRESHDANGAPVPAASHLPNISTTVPTSISSFEMSDSDEHLHGTEWNVMSSTNDHQEFTTEISALRTGLLPSGTAQEGDAQRYLERQSPNTQTWADRLAGQFAHDSSGNLRYLGGAPTFVLAEAVDAIRQAQEPTVTNPSSPGVSGPTVDHLYFRPNVLYRPLSGLPAPETIEYPPMIISNALVQVFFDRIHHTFPIVDKARFLARYAETMAAARSGRPSSDSHFLCVLFAVYASAANLTKTVLQDRTELEFSSPKEYVGLEFYERSLYLFWAGFRMMTIEHVTCMALLSSCLAGWNTLSQAWLLAGQAVRGAQDLGLHRSPTRAALDSDAKEYRRRVWWSVYGLDKILSVSLGRPSGINDDDCDTELPSDQSCCGGVDQTLEAPGNNPITGFVNLQRIYAIAGRIERVAHNITFLKEYDNSADHLQVRETIGTLDTMLEQWKQEVPPVLKDAVVTPQRPTMFLLGSLSQLCQYACILNLHRPFMPDFNTSSRDHTFLSLQRCMAAAQGCINVGETLHTYLPTSHHCSFTVQYLTISGVTLLRCLPYVWDQKPLITDAMRCRRLLAKMEDIWQGSKRCGALLQSLLDICEKKRTSQPTVHPLPRSMTAADQASRTDSGLNPGVGQAREDLGANNAISPQTAQQSTVIASSSDDPLFPGSTAPHRVSAPLDFDNHQTATQSGEATTYPHSSSPFDASMFTTSAPFDLGDEIGALLEQFQASAAAEADVSHWQPWDTPS